MRRFVFQLPLNSIGLFIALVFGIFLETSAQPEVDLAVRGVHAYQQKYYDSAAFLLDSAIKINPKLPSSILPQTGIDVRAIASYKNAISVYESAPYLASPSILLQLITIYTEINVDLNAARATLVKMKKLFPAQPEYYSCMAKILTLEGRNDLASDTLYYAVKLFPNDFTVLTNKIYFDLRYERYDEIVRTINSIFSQKTSTDIALKGHD